MRIRRFSGLAVTLVGVLAMTGLAACGSSGGDSGSSKTVVFRIWDEEQLPGYQKSIDVFTQQHPDIKVKVEQLPYADYWTKIITESAAGSGPDVFWDSVPYFPQLVKQGVIENLDPLIKQDSFDFGQFYPQVAEAYTYQGHKYGMPADIGMASMIYNKDLFDKAGVAAPADLTWAASGSGTLLSTAQKLTVDAKGKHPTEPGFDAKHITQWGFMADNHNQTQYVNWIPENGGNFMTEAFGKFSFNEPKAVEALQWQVDLINKWHVAPAPSAGKALDLFNRGQVAMYPAVNALLPYVVPKVNFKVGVAALPSGPAGRVANVNGLTFALNKHSKNSKAAWELVKWLGSADSQKIMGEGGYVWPANKSLSSTYLDYWKGKGQDLAPYTQAATGKTVPMPITPVWNAASLKIDNAFQLMFEGQQPVQKTTDDLVKQLNQLIEQQG
jgi:multiple sugar transport system substrate-binding protein